MEHICLDYSDFFTLTDARNINYQHTETDEKYTIFLVDGPQITYETEVWKTGNIPEGVDEDQNTTNLTDWITTRLADSNKPVSIKIDPIAASTVQFEGDGMLIEGVAGESVATDFQMTSSKILTGAWWKTKNSYWGDYITMQIVDVDNILGFGAGTILNQFIKKWYMIDELVMSERANGSLLPAGLYIRIIYTSVHPSPIGAANPEAFVNFFMSNKV